MNRFTIIVSLCMGIGSVNADTVHPFQYCQRTGVSEESAKIATYGLSRAKIKARLDYMRVAMEKDRSASGDARAILAREIALYETSLLGSK